MNMVALSACIGTRVPVVISERIDPGQHDIGRFKNVMRWMLYPLSKRLVVQTRQIADYFPDRLRPKISVVPNPIKVPTVQARPQQPAIDGRFKVVAAGRLTYQKAFDTLVAAYALVADHFQDWDLTIFGEGEERLWLERNIQERGLSKRVSLPGLRSDLQSELSNAHILAFPSRYEGFPNILAEGQAVGLPAVAYQKVSGVEDIVVDGQTGILVPVHQDHGAFAEALSMLMADAKQRLRMGAAARRNAEQWSPSAIFSSWDTVLARAASINERN
jgi:glycosyltransferase involved in cell wall biosynthesis